MNELAGLNTRLDGKEKYEKLNNKYLNDRRNQSCDIIQPSNNVFNNYENVKNNYEKYSRSDYKNILESEFNKKKHSYNNKQETINIETDNSYTNSVNFNSETKHDIENQYKKPDNSYTNSLNSVNQITHDVENQSINSILTGNIDNQSKNSVLTGDIENQSMNSVLTDDIENLPINENINNNKNLEEVGLLNDKFSNSIVKNNNLDKFKNVVLRILSKYNIETTDDEINNYFIRYNITSLNDIDKLEQLVFDVKQKNKPILKRNNLVKSKLKNQLISIDSNDMDKELSDSMTDFCIKLDQLNLQEVTSVSLKSAIFPKNIGETETIDEYPYILLEIKELGSNYKSINKDVNNAFLLLTFDTDLGNYKKITNNNSEDYRKTFPIPFCLNKLTIKIKRPNGSIINYNKKNLNLNFVFEITHKITSNNLDIY
uniref:Uncharacterized protein n=1 Tax=viral metagenome TaxID=1070528 RepID=A0A6C0IZR3_9ZZZZ